MLIPGKYLIYLGEAAPPLGAKTGLGLVQWRPDLCVGQWCTGVRSVDNGLPEMSPAAARAAGASPLVIGVAPSGGAIAPAWIAAIVAAIEAGLDVASGMHTRLGSVPRIADAAQRHGRRLFDVRYPARAFDVGSGRRRSGRRLLTVGTDCALGKKYTALSIAREMSRRGIDATFRATGQTGILIAGDGVAIDAVVADFIAGAAEWLSPDNAADHWDVIEGQGSLFHPAYAGVSTGLLHGSQPDALVVCHDATRDTIDEYPDFPIPGLRECIDLNLRMARLTNREVRCIGLSVNTSGLPAGRRDDYLRDLAARYSVPCFDPIATGTAPLVDFLVDLYPQGGTGRAPRPPPAATG